MSSLAPSLILMPGHWDKWFEAVGPRGLGGRHDGHREWMAPALGGVGGGGWVGGGLLSRHWRSDGMFNVVHAGTALSCRACHTVCKIGGVLGGLEPPRFTHETP